MDDCLVSNELKILALEAISNAGSGHSGSVLSATDAIYTLYTKHLERDNTNSILRDRFVLSNGHACAGLYAVLAGLGYFDIAELKNFRQYNGLLTGHPEINIPGIDCATGPLGQGVANAVGMAIAETILNAKFGVSHYTYCMVGDGCLEEGVALEALSVAGLYKLNKLVILYDNNNVTLDGKLSKSSTDNIVNKFKAMNFNVMVCNGHKISQIDNCLTRAKKCKDKPSIIVLKTIIGKDTELAGSNLSHGKVYSCKEIEKLKNKFKINNNYLELNDLTKNYLNEIKNKNNLKFAKKTANFNENLNKNKEKLKLFNNYLKINLNNLKIKFNLKNIDEISTRDANNIVLNEVAKNFENIVTLSADLSSSTKVKINDSQDYSANNRLGRNIAVGIREHAMGAIANGIALHGGLVPICSTFLTFSNYMLPAIRMACIMKLPVLFSFTHSSVYDTLDGITHLPVEQLDQLRLIPNLFVSRPADINECAVSYKWFLNGNYPMCLILSRGKLPTLKNNDDNYFGVYYVEDNKAKINIVASGSELRFALACKDLLKDKLNVNVVSAPCLEIFEQQSKEYKKKILKNEIFVVESGRCVKYLEYTTKNHIFGVDEFGRTGDEKNLINEFGFNPEKISAKILKIVKK